MIGTFPQDKEALAKLFAPFEKKIDHQFSDHILLAHAFTHSSVRGASRSAISHYERLEFLGDRVLGLVVARLLWERFPDADEGELSLRLNAAVNGATCADIADELGLHEFIRTGADVRQITGKRMASVRADVLEALMAVIYVDGGLEAAETFVRRFWKTRLDQATAARRDAKTALQEWSHQRRLGTPKYELISRSGADHDPIFEVKVVLDGVETCAGEGKSKRAAEQAAAEATLLFHKAWTEDE